MPPTKRTAAEARSAELAREADAAEEAERAERERLDAAAAPQPDLSPADPADEWEVPGADPTEASANPFPASQVASAPPVLPGDDDVEAERQRLADEANAVRPETPGSAPGPAVIDGPFGTTVDSADPGLGKLRVEVRSNVTLGNEVLTPFRKVEVPDDAEARACIHVGHLRLLRDDERLDDETSYEGDQGEYAYP